jgi:hypothetical protein
MAIFTFSIFFCNKKNTGRTKNQKLENQKLKFLDVISKLHCLFASSSMKKAG